MLPTFIASLVDGKTLIGGWRLCTTLWLIPLTYVNIYTLWKRLLQSMYELYINMNIKETNSLIV